MKQKYRRWDGYIRNHDGTPDLNKKGFKLSYSQRFKSVRDASFLIHDLKKHKLYKHWKMKL